MGSSNAVECPNCGAKKFSFTDSTHCKCEYCGSEWRFEDVLGLKKLEVDARLKESRQMHFRDILLGILQSDAIQAVIVVGTIIGLMILAVVIFSHL